MKRLLSLILMLSHALYAFNDPTVFKPLTGTCKQAFETCFAQCSKISPQGALCTEKKECLERFYAKSVNSLQPQKLYQQCESIKCPSQEMCTQQCFEQTKPGKCRLNCRKVTPICLEECQKGDPKNFSPCIKCCYTQKQQCEDRCCS